MTLLNLEEAGWKRICPNEYEYLPNIKRVLSYGGYRTIESEHYVLLEPLSSSLSPRKKLVSIRGSLDKSNFSRWRDIIASQNQFSSRFARKFHNVDIEDPENFSKSFLDNSGIKSFRALSSLVTVSSPGKILGILAKYAIPAFFDKYPNGRVYFIRQDEMLLNMNAVARTMSDADIFGFEIFKKAGDKERDIPRSMRQAHKSGFDNFIDCTLGSVLWGFFPYIYGIVASRIGGNIVFLFDKPFRTKPQKSTSEFFAEGGIFEGLEGNLSIEDLFEQVKKGQVNYTASYHKYVHETEFPPDVIGSLIEWSVVKLDYFYTYILDFCNFCNKNSFIDYALHRKIYLTLERIFIEIHKILLSVDSFGRKILYFDLHDKISSLMTTSSIDREEVFKRLLRASHYNKTIRQYLDKMPSPFNSYMANYGQAIYNAIMDTCIKEIWDERRKSKKGIITREIDLPNKDSWIGMKYKDGRTKISGEDYAINLIHEYRNTLHGYNLRDYKFEKYLALHEGSISDYLPDLSLVWLFCLLENIEDVLKSKFLRAS